MMLATTSHEFRNPLAGIMSMLTMLEGCIPCSHLKYLNIAKSSADMLLFLANDLLDYAQIEAGKLRLVYSPFNAKKAIESCVDLLRFKAESKDIEIVSQIHKNLEIVTVNSDENRFK